MIQEKWKVVKIAPLDDFCEYLSSYHSSINPESEEVLLS